MDPVKISEPILPREYLFIYGTLRYQPYFGLLGDAEFVCHSSVQGKLYLVEEKYPGFVKGEGIVLGEIYLIQSSRFPDLDEYEGELYLRRKILTSSQIECWIYESNLP